MTTPIAQHPENSTAGHDLDGGDLVVTAGAVKSQSLVIAGNSTDNNNWSASVEWQDADGNVVQTESKVDIGLDTTDNDNARLTRKGAIAVVTFTDETAAGTQNQLNAWVDTHM